jgi:thiol-disulfide isomerase/thioredoxin
MKQQCHISMIYLSWALYAGGLAYFGWRGQWVLALVWLAGVPLIEWLYIRKFPSLSPSMGYGRIVDEGAEATGTAPVKVVLYTALGCPFCPLIEQRLEDLRKQMGFTLEKIDVTLRPDLLAARGIRSVPVVEAGARLLFGLVTTKELAGAIAEAGYTVTGGSRR